EQHEGGQPDARGDRRAGSPARLEEALGERPGRAEGGTGEQGQCQAEHKTTVHEGSSSRREFRVRIKKSYADDVTAAHRQESSCFSLMTPRRRCGPPPR